MSNFWHPKAPQPAYLRKNTFEQVKGSHSQRKCPNIDRRSMNYLSRPKLFKILSKRKEEYSPRLWWLVVCQEFPHASENHPHSKQFWDIKRKLENLSGQISKINWMKSQLFFEQRINPIDPEKLNSRLKKLQNMEDFANEQRADLTFKKYYLWNLGSDGKKTNPFLNFIQSESNSRRYVSRSKYGGGFLEDRHPYPFETLISSSNWLPILGELSLSNNPPMFNSAKVKSPTSYMELFELRMRNFGFGLMDLEGRQFPEIEEKPKQIVRIHKPRFKSNRHKEAFHSRLTLGDNDDMEHFVVYKEWVVLDFKKENWKECLITIQSSENDDTASKPDVLERGCYSSLNCLLGYLHKYERISGRERKMYLEGLKECSH